MSDFESFTDESERLFDRAVDRKERLIQTYIVVSGLLVSCSPTPPNLNAFFVFLVCTITYYVELSKKRLPDFLTPNVSTIAWKLAYFNVLGIVVALNFAYVIVDFIKNIYTDSRWFFVGEFIFLTITVARSLFLNFPEFTPRKPDKIET